MIRVTETGPGKFKFERDWPDGYGIQFVLKLIDPDGDEDSRLIIWKASDTYTFREALAKARKLVEELPHWRAELMGDQEIAINPVQEGYEYSVKVSIVSD